MKICWFSLILLLSCLKYVPINGDTYHYQVIRKMCPAKMYHDPLKDRCRNVPGGGEMIKINIDARCSGGFEGLLAHSKKSRFYYVCKKEGVLTCMCGKKEYFNKIKLKCESKCQKGDEFTHDVVDHIVDKYKCAIMNGVYVEDHCELPLGATTNLPTTAALRSSEEFDNRKIAKLQNMLRYLVFLRTVDDIHSKIPAETTTTIPPQTIIVRFETEATTVPTTQKIDPITPPSIEDEINMFKKNWNLDPTKQTTLATTTEQSAVSGRILEDETSTISSTTLETTTDALTTIETTEFSEPILKETTMLPEVKPRILKRLKIVTTTEEPEAEQSYEEYFEYFYEDDPNTVIKKSNVTKKMPNTQVMGKAFGDEEEDWKQTVIFTETTTENLDTTTLMDETTTEIATENPTTDYSTTELSTTTEMAPEPLIRRLPDDLDYNDFDSLKMKSTSTTTDQTSTITEETTNFDDFAEPITTENPETTSFDSSTIDSTTTQESTINTESTVMMEPTNFEIFAGRYLNFWTQNYDKTTTEPTSMSTEIETSTTELATSTTDFITSTTDYQESTSEVTESTTEYTTESTTDYTTEFVDPRFDEFSTEGTTEDFTTTTEISTTTDENQTTDDSVRSTSINEGDFSTLQPTTTDSQTISTESTTILDTTTVNPSNQSNDDDLNSQQITLTTFSTLSTTEVPQPRLSELPETKKKKEEEFEYYYSYEEYAVDEDGTEVKPQNGDKKIKKKIVKKTRRDNSNEYYQESISASHERQEAEKGDDYDY